MCASAARSSALDSAWAATRITYLSSSQTPLNLERAFDAALPRLTLASTPWASLVIHASVAVAAAALLACACLAHGLAAWAVGLAYVGWDVAMMTIVVLATLPLRRARQATTGEERPTLGVLVAAHDEAAALPLTLRALLAQTDPPDLILVADDGSRDDTATVLARQFGLAAPALGGVATSATYPALRWLRLPRGGKARALNAALLAADTDVVLTIDGDTAIEAGAVAAFRAAFAADPRLVAAGGVLTPVCDGTRLGRVAQFVQRQEYARNALTFAAWARLDMLLHIPGAFAGFSRDALLSVGGFDPSSLVEDYEAIHRLRGHSSREGLGWTTSMVGTRAMTDAPSRPAPFLAQRRRWFSGFLETQLRYRDMVGDPRYGRTGWLMLPIKAVDTVQPLLGLATFVLLLGTIATGHWDVLGPVVAVLAAKIGLDLALHLWAAQLSKSWADSAVQVDLGRAIVAVLVGPVSFQMLRHLGAALGWVSFLTGDRTWARPARVGLVAVRDVDSA